MAATERIQVLVSPEQKARIASKATTVGMTMSEFLRCAADAYALSEDEAIMQAMIEQLTTTTAQACTAIDDALSFVEASNLRIADLERQGHGKDA